MRYLFTCSKSPSIPFYERGKKKEERILLYEGVRRRQVNSLFEDFVPFVSFRGLLHHS